MFKVGDIIRLKKPHSEGDTVVVQEILEEGYKIYIPYWDYFLVQDDIIEKVGNVNDE